MPPRFQTTSYTYVGYVDTYARISYIIEYWYVRFQCSCGSVSDKNVYILLIAAPDPHICKQVYEQHDPMHP